MCTVLLPPGVNQLCAVLLPPVVNEMCAVLPPPGASPIAIKYSIIKIIIIIIIKTTA
jgi:hypothetical protein